MTFQKLIGHVTQPTSAYVTKQVNSISCGEYVWEKGRGSITNNCHGDWRDIVQAHYSYFCAGVGASNDNKGIWKATYSNNNWTFTAFNSGINASCYFVGALHTNGLPGDTVIPLEALITSFEGQGIWYRNLFDASANISTTWTQTNIKTGTCKLCCNLSHHHTIPQAMLVSNGGRKIYFATIYSYKTSWDEYSLGSDVYTCYALIELNSGRVLACTDAGIKYSDNGGESWNTLVDNKFVTSITSIVDHNKERLFATFRNKNNEVYYSDDGGLTWTGITLDATNLGLVSVSQILIEPGNNYTLDNLALTIPLGNVPDISYKLGTLQVNVSLKTSVNKYLDQNGVQEIVTQFKAYCDNLVGGV